MHRFSVHSVRAGKIDKALPERERMNRLKLKIVCIDNGSAAHDRRNCSPIEPVTLCQLAAISQKAGKLPSRRAPADDNMLVRKTMVLEPGLGGQNTLLGIIHLSREPVMGDKAKADRDEAVPLMAPDPRSIDHGLGRPNKECPAMEPEDRLFMHGLRRLPDDAVLETPWSEADALRCTSKHLVSRKEGTPCVGKGRRDDLVEHTHGLSASQPSSPARKQTGN